MKKLVIPIPDNRDCVIRSRKGKFIKWCDKCKLMLATIDRRPGNKLQCPRCDTVTVMQGAK